MEEIFVDWREAADCVKNVTKLIVLWIMTIMSSAVSEAHCTGGTVPVPQGSACPNTCKHPMAAEDCEMENTEACECPDEQVLRDGNCVDLVRNYKQE